MTRMTGVLAFKIVVFFLLCEEKEDKKRPESFPVVNDRFFAKRWPVLMFQIAIMGCLGNKDILISPLSAVSSLSCDLHVQ